MKRIKNDEWDRKAFSRSMKKQEKAEKAKQLKQQAEEQAEENIEETVKEPSVALAKTNKLVFFRQYNTYQALLEVHPSGDADADLVYSKVILYIMRWFRNRLGEDAYKSNPDIAFLWNQYPDPEDYASFKLDEVSNINGFDFIDFETAFLKDKKAWVVSLTEPDNGHERKDIQGRTFTTEISVYKQDNSVVLGIKESCREPQENIIDAVGYRPGFVRDIFYDKDLILSEQGIHTEYAFSHEAYRINGKSGENCKNIYEGLIASKERQMPVLFIPGDFYEKNREEVDKKTVSLLGYCHVVVCENGCRKLFEQTMDNPEFAEVFEEGQLIFYRTNGMQEYPSAYFEDDGSDDLLDNIKMVAQNEPLRKYCDFKDFLFKKAWSDGSGKKTDQNVAEIDEICDRYETEISRLNKLKNDLERDNDHLQRKNDALEAENNRLDKENTRSFSDISRKNRALDDAIAERDRYKDESRRLQEEVIRKDMINRGLISETKERYKPIINLPPLGLDKKEEILEWIEEYYTDLLVIHSKARDSFLCDKRNIDWHRFCMMIHYLAGYTRHRNEGGLALDPNAARDYDPEDSACKVDPSSSGQGATEFHKDKYTITIFEGGKNKDVILDLHLKYGKGSDSDMLRIYFYYSPVEKKSFIGFMPGHLPLR